MRVPRTKVLSRRRFGRNRSLLVLRPAPWRTSPGSGNPELPQAPHRLKSHRLDKKLISVYLFVFGGVLCAYVIGTYLWMYERQHKLLNEWKNQNAVSKTLTKISIPRIQLEAVVLDGADPHSLLLGPGHLVNSAAPGSAGNVVVAGHRDTFFRHVHSLRYGDDIYLSRGADQFHYVVVARKIVEPTDLSVLRNGKYGELTLITCYPTHAIGPAPLRLVVVAKKAAEPVTIESKSLRRRNFAFFF